MAKPKQDGGAAFPKPFSTDEHKDQCNIGFEEQGMTLRDYFAGQVLVGETANDEWANTPNASKLIAVYCYGLADEMIAARDAWGGEPDASD